MQKNINFINLIKLLLYKENPSLLEKVDLEDDNIFLEPLFFAYFNSKKDNLFAPQMLTEILQGYFLEKEPLVLKKSFNRNGVAYVPNLGYFNKGGNKIDNIYRIENTSIELIIHPIIHLKAIFRDFNENVIDENKIEISKGLCEKYKNALTNAFQYIRLSNEEHFQLIQDCCKKVVLFKTDPQNTNSFATINAHGIAFFNVYQEEYDEVFFIDDIAHQTGHIILTTLFFDRKKNFLIDENLNIGAITNNKSEYRSFYILFHALYTYYTTVLHLDLCLENRFFNERQIHEAKGRIGFYLLKYRPDLENFEKIIKHNKTIENVLTKESINIFKIISDKYHEMMKKYNSIVMKYNYKNQPYNFTYKDFKELNHNDD